MAPALARYGCGMPRRVASSLVLALASTACADAPSARPWAWQQTSPEAQGVDSDRLADLLDEVVARELHLHSLLLVRHDAIVLDASLFPYAGDRPHDVASCTKSLTSLAVGLAIADGALGGVDDRLLPQLAARPAADADGRKAAITLGDALTMTAGFDCVAAPEQTLMAMLASDDFVQFTVDLPMASDPGATWNYCSPVSHLLSAVVGHATGAATDEWLRARLFDPLGIAEVPWPRDAQGITHGWGDARLMPRDLARIGVLLLHEGSWDDTAVLDPAWITASTTAQIAETGTGTGYGYQWWVAPERGVYFATGRGGQNLFVAPELDAVVVTTGSGDPVAAGAIADVLAELLIPAIVADEALPERADATQRLAEAVARVGLAPAPGPVEPTPERARELSGRALLAQDNPLGWSGFSLEFAGDTAALTIDVAGRRSRAEIGLDGRPRITHAVTFTSDPRHADASVALVGRWLDDATLQVEFDTIESIDAGTLTFGFVDDGVVVAVHERTFLDATLIFRADLAP